MGGRGGGAVVPPPPSFTAFLKIIINRNNSTSEEIELLNSKREKNKNKMDTPLATIVGGTQQRDAKRQRLGHGFSLNGGFNYKNLNLKQPFSLATTTKKKNEELEGGDGGLTKTSLTANNTTTSSSSSSSSSLTATVVANGVDGSAAVNVPPPPRGDPKGGSPLKLQPEPEPEKQEGWVWSPPTDNQLVFLTKKYPLPKEIKIGQTTDSWGGRPSKVIKTFDGYVSMICSHGDCIGLCYNVNLCRYHFDRLDLLSRRIPKANLPTLFDVLNSSLSFRRRLPPLVWNIVTDKEFELIYKLHGFGKTPSEDAVDFKIGSTPLGERRFLAIYHQANNITLEELCPVGGCNTVYDKNKICRIHPLPKKIKDPSSSSSSAAKPRITPPPVKEEDTAMDRLQTAIDKLSSRKKQQFEWRRSTASESDFFTRAFSTKTQRLNNNSEFFIVHNQEGAPIRRFVAILDINNMVTIQELCTQGACLKCAASSRLCREHFEES